MQSSAVNEVNLDGRIAAGVIDRASVNLSDTHDVQVIKTRIVRGFEGFAVG